MTAQQISEDFTPQESYFNSELKRKEIAENWGPGLKQAIIDYARQKCEEQRQNCYYAAKLTYSGDAGRHIVDKAAIRNAPEPNFE